MVDFNKYCGPQGQRALIELNDKIKKERQEYEVKINKLMELFDNGDLPNTKFINSFMPRVNYKFKQDLFPLTEREKEIIDQLFEEN